MDKPICASCGMPMAKNQISKFDKRFCIYCQNQKNGRLKTKAEVIEGSIGAAMKFLGKSRVEAENMVKTMLPKLERWKNQTNPGK